MNIDFLYYAIPFVIVLVVLVIAYFRKHPTAEVTAKADLKTFMGELTAELSKISASIKAHTAAVAAPVAVTVEPAPVVVPGKSGEAGTFSIAVTGDPATDLPAITAAYLAK